MSEIKAKRIKGYEELDRATVCYWKVSDGSWLIHFPHKDKLLHDGIVGNLRAHTVVEHEDGTITVTPSILTTYHGADGRHQVHGYLTKGIWRDC